MTTNELEIWKRLNELPEVKKAFGEWVEGDWFIPSGGDGTCEIGCCYNPCYMEDSDIWIPKLYDPIRPERSLWYLSGDIRWNWSVDQKLQFMLDARPDLALAKAIIEQEGKKGEGDGTRNL